MTERSTSAQLSEHLKISFVFPVHDPEYGGGLLARTQKHLDALIELANRYRLRSEIIVVEWNPRQDRPRFRESLRWPDDLGHVCLRFIEVPAEIHRTFANADRLPIFEYIAKNAGLRRARGQFLLATNPDLFYSPALVRWLARASLSSERFYRVDRRDLSEDIPGDLSLSRRLRFCSRHVGHVHALFGSYRFGDAGSGRRLRDEYDHCTHDPDRASGWIDTPDARLVLPADGLHRNAAGDFFLMERECWHRLRGYPELHTHAHIDAILCWVASSNGLVQEVLPPRCHLYHQAHHRASHAGFPQTQWRSWYKRYRQAMRQDRSRKDPPMVVNPPDWGLANEVLPEWEPRPRLPRAQVRTGGVAEQRQRSPNAADNAQRTLMEKLTGAETSLAMTRSDLQHTRAELEIAEQKHAELRAALREAQRAHKGERTALKAALQKAQVAERSEAALRHKLESSTAWRITGPIRRALVSLNGLRRTPPRSLRVHPAENGIPAGREHGLMVKPQNENKDRTQNASPPPARDPEVVRGASVVDPPAPPTAHEAPPRLPLLLSQRCRDLDPLRVFNVPGDAPRVSIVTDSLGASSRFDGSGTALIIAALLARHLGARLRLITLTEPPDTGKAGAVLRTHRIPWTGDMEFVHVGPERKDEVSLGDDELFLTTSWWSTRCVLPIVAPGRLVYLLQEDERVSTASGDERRRCVETLSDPHIRFVINSRQLFDRLTQGPDALPNVSANGAWFEPAFPAGDRQPAALEVGAEHSSLAIGAESRSVGLNQGMVPATARAVDRDRSHANLGGADTNQDWEAAVAPVLARLYPDRRLG